MVIKAWQYMHPSKYDRSHRLFAGLHDGASGSELYFM